MLRAYRLPRLRQAPHVTVSEFQSCWVCSSGAMNAPHLFTGPRPAASVSYRIGVDPTYPLLRYAFTNSAATCGEMALP